MTGMINSVKKYFFQYNSVIKSTPVNYYLVYTIIISDRSLPIVQAIVQAIVYPYFILKSLIFHIWGTIKEFSITAANKVRFII